MVNFKALHDQTGNFGVPPFDFVIMVFFSLKII